jgi:hypothetical protein
MEALTRGSVLLLRRPQPSQLCDAESRELPLPPIRSLLADPELVDDLGRGSARLSLPECERKLLF